MQGPIDDLVRQARELEELVKVFPRSLGEDVARVTTQVDREAKGIFEGIDQALRDVEQQLKRLGSGLEPPKPKSRLERRFPLGYLGQREFQEALQKELKEATSGNPGHNNPRSY